MNTGSTSTIQSNTIERHEFELKRREELMSSSSSSSSFSSMVVVFGKPGAGKTTISNAVVKKMEGRYTNTNTCRSSSSSNSHEKEQQRPICLLLDLDICIPEWMKDNFAKGIYPTLDQRNEFARSACNYVDGEIHKAKSSNNNSSINNNNKDKNNNPNTGSDDNHLFTIISFSFVNTDLRDYFRLRFPHAKWALVDVSNTTAQERIEQREGHFYKGAPKGSSTCNIKTEKDLLPKRTNENADIDVNLVAQDDDKVDDNSEWEFAPVEFDHIVLDGLLSIEQNVNRLIDTLDQMSQ